MEEARAAREVTDLTAREVEVLQLAADGLTNPQIGERIHVSADTVKLHLRHASEALGVRFKADSPRAATVAEALRRGLIR